MDLSNAKDIIRDQVSQVMANMIIDHVQTYIDICLSYGIGKESLERINKEFTERTRIHGLKVRKVKSMTWITSSDSTSSSELPSISHQQSAVQFYASELRRQILEIDGCNVPVYTSVDLLEGFNPAIGDPTTDLATFAVRFIDGEYEFRHLTDTDKIIMEDQGVPYRQ